MKTLQNTNAWLPAIFDDLLKEGRIDAHITNSATSRVNIIENDNEFTLQVLAPGFSKKSFAIAVEKDMLVISGNTGVTEVATENKSIKYTRKEFAVKDFKRSFTLPETVAIEAIKASYKNGILAVSLPKMEEVVVKKKMVEIS